MSFISYAQNFEDVMLWRALKHVENGFYIDVGANDPVADSVTKAFYDNGWNGINVEPVSQWFIKLEQERTRDINLQLAVGSSDGELEFYDIPDTGLSTTNLEIANRHKEEQGFDFIKRMVPLTTITAIYKEYDIQTIHFLKIDVEGAEFEVLKGIDFQKIRPWLLVIESTLPTTKIESFENWEPLILNAKYEFVYFDGLNRFYVATEHTELAGSFKKPPNIFDDFILSGLSNSVGHKQIKTLNDEIIIQKIELKNITEEKQKVLAVQEKLKLDIQNASNNKDDLEIKIQEQNLKNNDLIYKLLEKETKQQSLNIELDRYKQQLFIIEKNLAEKDEQCNYKIKKIENKLFTQQLKEQEHLLSLLEKETQFQKINISYNDQEVRLKDLSKKAKKNEIEINSYEQDIKEYNENLNNLTIELETSNQKIDELHQSNHHWWTMTQEQEKKLQLANQKIDELHQSNHHWWTMTQEQEKKLQLANQKMDELHQSNHHWWTMMQEHEQQLQAVYKSMSWRITWPLRKLLQVFMILLYFPKSVAKWLLVKLIKSVLTYNNLTEIIIKRLQNWPNIYNKLRGFSIAQGVIVDIPAQTINEQLPKTVTTVIEQPIQTTNLAEDAVLLKNDTTQLADLSSLTPSARRIYNELKTAIDKHKVELN